MAESGLSALSAVPVATVAQGDVAVLDPGGWSYHDGTPLWVDGARSVTGLDLPYYRSAAVLQSTVLTAAESVTRMQVDATVDSVPAGTGIRYQVSTDGGSTWTGLPYCALLPGAAPPDTRPPAGCGVDDAEVPGGSPVAYRLAMTTTDPDVTPVVDLSQVLEIGTTQATPGTGQVCAAVRVQPCVVLVR